MTKCKCCGAEIVEDFQKIVYKNKEFRIYKWESKPIRDFKIPDGFDFAEFNDFVELYDKKKIELEVWKDYYVKHFSKIQQKKESGLSWLCLYRDLNLWSGGDDLANSDSVGRVCVSRDLKAVGNTLDEECKTSGVSPLRRSE
jgi:hypothetical protein